MNDLYDYKTTKFSIIKRMVRDSEKDYPFNSRSWNIKQAFGFREVLRLMEDEHGSINSCPPVEQVASQPKNGN